MRKRSWLAAVVGITVAELGLLLLVGGAWLLVAPRGNSVIAYALPRT